MLGPLNTKVVGGGGFVFAASAASSLRLSEELVYECEILLSCEGCGVMWGVM